MVIVPIKSSFINSLHSLSLQSKHQNIMWNLFKIKTKNIRTMSMTSFCCSGVFVANFGQIFRIVLVFQLQTFNSEIPTGNNLLF